MKQFDKPNLKTLRADLEAALAIVSKKHNIILSTANISYSATEATIKVKAMTKAEGVETALDARIAKFAEDFKINAFLYGMKVEDLGKTYKSGSKIFTVVGLDSKKRKNAIVVKDQLGKTYISSPESVNAALAYAASK